MLLLQHGQGYGLQIRQTCWTRGSPDMTGYKISEKRALPESCEPLNFTCGYNYAFSERILVVYAAKTRHSPHRHSGPHRQSMSRTSRGGRAIPWGPYASHFSLALLFEGSYSFAPLPSPISHVPLEVDPLHTARYMGKRYKFPRRGLGRSHSGSRIVCILLVLKADISGGTNFTFTNFPEN